MAPKKAKKNKKNDFEDDGEDLELGDIPAAAKVPAKVAPTAKKKKAKKKPAAGDWSDDEDTPVASVPVAEDDDEEIVAPKKKSKSKKPVNFAILQDGEDSEGEVDGPAITSTKAAAFAALAGSEDAEVDDDDESSPAIAESHSAHAEHAEQSDLQETGAVCAEIMKVSKHPSADRLKVCQVRTDIETLQVVTNAPNIREHMKVAFAGEGVSTPGSGITVGVATVRGVKSFGMICSAYDLDWMDEANGWAAELPGNTEPGHVLGSSPMQGAILSEEAAKATQGKEKGAKDKKAKAKGKKFDDAFVQLALEDDEAPGSLPADEPVEATLQLNGKHDAGEEEEDEHPVTAKPKKGKKKKKGVDIASAFAALEVEDSGDDDSPDAQQPTSVADADEKPQTTPAANGHADDLPQPKGKKKKDKRSVADIDALLASLEEQPSTAQPEREEGQAQEDSAAVKGKKKKKKEKGVDPIDALLAEIEGPPGPSSEGAPPAEPAEEPAEAEALPPPPTDKPEAKAKGKKGKKKGKQEAEQKEEKDLDALLAELDMVPSSKAPAELANVPADTPADAPVKPEADAAQDGKGKKKKGKKKGKQAAAAEDEEDLDALLAEMDMAPGSKASEGIPAAATAGDAPAEGNAAGPSQPEAAGDGAAEGAADGTGLSAAAKKKIKKKAKEKAKKAAGAEEPEGDEDEEAAVPVAPKKGGKKQSAAVLRMREAMERKQREEEERKRLEEEQRAREEEAARLAEEAEARKIEEAARRKAEKAARKAQLKAEGKLLTAKEKKERERLDAIRAQYLKAADEKLQAEALGKEAETQPEKPRKPMYGRKRPNKKTDSRTGPVDSQPSVEEAQEAAASNAAAEEEAKRLQEEDLRRQEEELRKAEEAVAAAAAAGEEASSEESEDTNWEDMDLNAVKLPGQKEEALPAEAPKRTAEAADTATTAEEAPQKKAKHEEEEGKSEDEDEDEEETSDEETSDEESSDDEDDSSEEETSSEEESSSEMDSEDEREERLARQREIREARLKAAQESGSKDDLRSPICCILGHVDTGKTKLLDNLRRTNVQEGEAGGITQQIGATYVPGDAIMKRTEPLRRGTNKTLNLKLPGLLIIDTPGHESFTNLRSRGSNLCDIAILVVDLMHGMEQQTIESINLLKARKTPFIIALNKVDRLFDWKSEKDAPIRQSLERQKPHVRAEFEQKFKQSRLNLNEQGLNVALFWENPDVRRYVNIVPTSAISGEGIPDMLQLLVELTQAMMAERLMFISELQCTVLEVKVIEGLGTTIDVVLVNGVLHEGDTIVVCGLNGPIVTTIRSLLTPHPLKELRVKGSYEHHKMIKAAQGVKISAQNLETAVAGTQLLVVGEDDDVETLKLEVVQDMKNIFSSVDRSGVGVCVQASTLGSLEALLEFLRTPAVNIPVSGIAIGPVHKKDVTRASVMQKEPVTRKYAVILAFDVPVSKEAQEVATKEGVRIFTADIIYHLFDQFTNYLREVKEAEQEAAKVHAVFPCILKILPTCVFNKKDPIVLGVDIIDGIAKVGTPLCIPSQGGFNLGRIASIELNHKPVDKARKGDSVAMKIEAANASEATKLYGRHFDHKDELVSRISRESINVLKEHFRDELGKEDWRLVIKLKKVFGID